MKPSKLKIAAVIGSLLLSGMQSWASWPHSDETLKEIIKAGTGGHYQAECDIKSRHFKKWGNNIVDIEDHTLNEKVSLVFKIMTGETILPWIHIDELLASRFPNRNLNTYPSGIHAFKFENILNETSDWKDGQVEWHTMESNLITSSRIENTLNSSRKLWGSLWEDKSTAVLHIDRFGPATRYIFTRESSAVLVCPTKGHCVELPDLEKYEYNFDCKMMKL